MVKRIISHGEVVRGMSLRREAYSPTQNVLLPLGQTELVFKPYFRSPNLSEAVSLYFRPVSRVNGIRPNGNST
jgi:hypothetical protein